MQDHKFSFVIEASVEELWDLFMAMSTRDIEVNDVKVKVLHPGGENALGLIRKTQFKVPKILLTGGIARSWEYISEVKPYEMMRYDAIGKPLWSKASGWISLERLDSTKTRVHFRETYEALNPISRFFLERYVHNFISRDNDKLMRQAMEQGLKAFREMKRQPSS